MQATKFFEKMTRPKALCHYLAGFVMGSLQIYFFGFVTNLDTFMHAFREYFWIPIIAYPVTAFGAFYLRRWSLNWRPLTRRIFVLTVIGGLIILLKLPVAIRQPELIPAYDTLGPLPEKRFR